MSAFYVGVVAGRTQRPPRRAESQSVQTVCDPSDMPNGPTPRRAIRIDDETWEAAAGRADLEHRTVSDVVRIALRAYAEGSYDALPVPIRRQQ